ncbi:hypothetical protein PPERSA_13179 [Pseudocohnilembus persalinus]|uniref:Uncharacterized protein n=1 Tax=Pseudocohnilembus persalinus TaxID=266149 RepID=A0A0V0QL03_PSEPJ|nr:hypothetical protein PPERSA_13179 [Pseudocohnilembus persalinus]|eukprot:KRX02925.1 hypothetical protein PPERSA_13179 [Pseudocohnilembus persalinus]
MMANNMNQNNNNQDLAQIQQNDLNLNILNLFSHNQLVNTCLDFMKQALKFALTTFYNSKIQIQNQQQQQGDFSNGEDFQGALELEYQIDPRYIRSYLFEIKNTRHKWAHNDDFNLRQVHRIYDTSQFLLEELKVPESYEVYVKISTIRRILLVKLGEEEYNKIQGIQQPQNPINLNNNNNNQNIIQNNNIQQQQQYQNGGGNQQQNKVYGNLHYSQNQNQYRNNNDNYFEHHHNGGNMFY